ncbi:MAG: hypothetical protein IT376_19115 [Polyangiaceae bacterium]|nr:hypothetical protein [Polyangiaceae bacterium]
MHERVQGGWHAPTGSRREPKMERAARLPVIVIGALAAAASGACAPRPPRTGYAATPTPDGEGVVLRGHLAASAPDPVPRLLAVREWEFCSGSGEPGQYCSIQCLDFGVVSISLEGRNVVLVCSKQDDHGCKALFEELTATGLLPGPAPTDAGQSGPELGGAAAQYRGCRVVADDGADLGVLGSKDDPDSVCNPFGPKGSRYASDSVWNRYGRYGGENSSTGALNRYAQRPPAIVCGRAQRGRLTRNAHLPGAVAPSAACPGREE